MAENSIKIKKILEAGKIVYPATILDAVKDATAIIDGKTNGNYGKTLREILANQASSNDAAVEALDKKLHGDSTASDQAVKDGELKTLETTVKTYTDNAVKALDVTGNVSDAVAGVSVTVNETDGKVVKPVVAVADNVVTYTAKSGDTAANLAAANTTGVIKGESIAKIKSYVDAVVADAVTEAGNDVDALETKIYGADGTGTTAGTVKDINDSIANLAALHASGTHNGKSTVAEEAAAAVAAVVDGADGAFDTLKEIANWINDSDSAKEGFNAAQRIVDLETEVGADNVADSVKGRIAALESTNAAADFTVTDAAVAGKYVSQVSQAKDGKITVVRADLPTLSVKTGSANYVGVSNHEVEIKTSALTAGLSTDTDGSLKAGTATTATGLATAAAVDAKLAADEAVVAEALNDHESRVAALEGLAGDTSVANQIKAAVEALDVTSNTSDVVKGVSVAVTETDGKVNKPVVAVTPATVTFTAADGAAESALAATANSGNVLDSTAIAAIKSYVDDRFSTGACTDTTDYPDVF